MKRKRNLLSVNNIVSFLTLILIVLVVALSWKSFIKAWNLLGEANLWILSLLIPLQILSYMATGEVLFSYLRAQNRIRNISPLNLARLSLEMNFVNHVLPSAGVSGISYMGWRLRKFGVSADKSSAAQIVRVVMLFIGFTSALFVSLIYLIFTSRADSLTIMLSSFLIFIMIAASLILYYFFKSKARLIKCADFLTKSANKFTKIFSLGRKKRALKSKDILRNFFTQIHRDFDELGDNKKILIKPLIWSFIFAIAEVGMFYVAFLAMGTTVNFALLFIAYGLAGLAGTFMVTPGGAGVYELIMVTFLTSAGVSPEVGIAAIVLSRVILVLSTILFGYGFYYDAIQNSGDKKVLEKIKQEQIEADKKKHKNV